MPRADPPPDGPALLPCPASLRRDRLLGSGAFATIPRSSAHTSASRSTRRVLSIEVLAVFFPERSFVTRLQVKYSATLSGARSSNRMLRLCLARSLRKGRGPARRRRHTTCGHAGKRMEAGHAATYACLRSRMPISRSDRHWDRRGMRTKLRS
jgi:hypothetical protein